MPIFISLVFFMFITYIAGDVTSYVIPNFSENRNYYLSQLLKRIVLINVVAIGLFRITKFNYASSDTQAFMDFLSKGLFTLWCVVSMMLTVQYCQMILPPIVKLLFNKKRQSSSMTAEEVIRIAEQLHKDALEGKPLSPPKISTLEKDRFYTLKLEADKIRKQKGL